MHGVHENSHSTSGLFGKDNVASVTQSGRVTVHIVPSTLGVPPVNTGSHTGGQGGRRETYSTLVRLSYLQASRS